MFAQKAASHWVIPVEFLFVVFVYCKVFDIRLVASYDVSLLLSIGGNIFCGSSIFNFIFFFKGSND